jgi:hypothetical protein
MLLLAFRTPSYGETSSSSSLLRCEPTNFFVDFDVIVDEPTVSQICKKASLPALIT